jgi:hypothetical protein
MPLTYRLTDVDALAMSDMLELVAVLREENQRLRTELAAQLAHTSEMERRERELLGALSVHAAWDSVVCASCDVPEMPPLFPQVT